MSTKKLHNITDVSDLRGKRVILRASLNAPVQDGVVTNDFRLKRALPTIEFLQEAGAKTILVAHIGRDPEVTIEPIFRGLEKMTSISWAGGLLGSVIEAKIKNLEDGDVLMLENLRSDVGEKDNDAAFAKTLASYADIFVNDAFAVSHREHASIVGIPKHIPGYAGLTFAKEYDELSKALKPEHPALFVLGGAKFATKQPLIEKFLKLYDHIFVGGALANDFFAGQGFHVGDSVVSDLPVNTDELMKTGKILLPTDIVVVQDDVRRTLKLGDVEPDEKILDAGPETMMHMKEYIEQAKTVLWNGPLGFYEERYVEGTHGFARIIAQSDAYSIVGGGDTIAAIEELGLADDFSFLSTAGGAMLTFLEGGTLPGIDAVQKSKHG